MSRTDHTDRSPSAITPKGPRSTMIQNLSSSRRPHHTSRAARGIARLGAVAVAPVVATCLLGAAAGPASASTVDGKAVIAAPGVTTPLTSGGSTTPFTVVLPAQAACDGDTATGGYHVYSYLVHKGTAVSGVTFVNFPSAGLGLVDNTGTYYGPVNTAVTTGQIIGIPNSFQWAPLVSGGGTTLAQLLYTGSGATASGTWEAGLVCANTHGAVADNWNIEVTFSASAGDPTGFTWTAVPSGTSAPAITSATSTTFTAGTAGTFSVVTSGSPAPTVTETGALPAGVTFTGGTLTGTPTATGTFPITFTASNGIGSAATQSFTLTVQAASGTTTTTTTDPGSTTTTTAPGSTTSTTPPAAGGTGDTGASSTGAGGSGSGSSSLAYTGFHTGKAIGLGVFAIGLGIALLGWGYRRRARPAKGSTP